MNSVGRCGGPRTLGGFVVMLAALLAWPAAAPAQTLVLGNVVGEPEALLAQVPGALLPALEKHGAKIVSREDYLAAAAKAGIGEKKAFGSSALRKLAPKLGLTGQLVVRVGKERVRVVVLGPKGDVAHQDKLDHSGSLSAELFDGVAAALCKALGGSPTAPADKPAAGEGTGKMVGETMELNADDLQMENMDPEEEAAAAADKLVAIAAGPPKVKADQPAKAGDKPTAGESSATPAAEAGEAGEGETDGGSATPEPGAEAGEGGAAEGEAAAPETPAEPKGPPAPPGAIPDVLAAAGPSMNFRAGLSPRHASGAFPGLHVEAHAFVGAFLDMDWVEDIGLGFGFDIGLGLQYGAADGGSFDALQYAWSVDLLYRLALLDDVVLKPTFLVRLGVGSTTATIDTSQAGLHDAGYLYPYGVLQTVLQVWDPYLTVHVDAGYLFAVFASEDLSGTGSGFVVGGGVDGKLFDMITIGIGYEMRQFLGVAGTGNLGTRQTMADVYHLGYLRAGWVFQ